jgi:hypothetical protein
VLERIGRSFMQIMGEGRLKVHSFRKELKTKGFMIVDAVAATLDHFAETRSSIHADHQYLVRFRSAEDPGFTRVTAILLNWIQVDQSEVAIIETGMIASRHDQFIHDGIWGADSVSKTVSLRSMAHQAMSSIDNSLLSSMTLT